jgi:hypothetical protein
MKLLSPSIVLVKHIHCDISRDKFSEELIEECAPLILELGGVISPPILKRDRENPFSYAVVDGHLAYYAAVRAKELDLIRGESINAYIIEPEDNHESIFFKQIEFFNKIKGVFQNTPSVIEKNPHQPISFQQIEHHLQTFLGNINNVVDIFREEIKTLVQNPIAEQEILIPSLETQKINSPLSGLSISKIKTETNYDFSPKAKIKKESKKQTEQLVEFQAHLNEAIIKFNNLSSTELNVKLQHLGIRGLKNKENY